MINFFCANRYGIKRITWKEKAILSNVQNVRLVKLSKGWRKKIVRGGVKKSRLRFVWLIASLGGAIIFLTGCGTDAVVSALKSATNFQTAKVWLEKVHFKASDDVNDTSPVTVDIVVAYKADLLAELLKMEAETYYRKLDQLKSDYAGQLDVFTWDIIRGQRLEVEISPSRVSGEGVVVFARYSSPGAHRAAIAEDREVIIQLDKMDFKVIPVKPTPSS